SPGRARMGRFRPRANARPSGDVVPVMTTHDVLASRLNSLRSIIQHGFANAPEQVQGFLVRVLSTGCPAGEGPVIPEPSLNECLASARFGGYPSLARSGYCLGWRRSCPLDSETARLFLHAIQRQRERSAYSQAELAGDAIALLGIADGL